ncbi:MAG TPA: serine/threonine-protein kinase, partial [Tepidisphaeraceae bacterium]|nr:serine/threonine-protein kinase [Tepidisphaeraceae bacterium]
MANTGQRIGEYILDTKVGGGAFGEVWRAHHHVWVDQLVAIKIPTDPQYVRNLQREGAAIHGLVHPNIARALGFDPYADPAYLTMEYVPGTSLRPLIKPKSLAVNDSLAILRQVLAGLSHAHKSGIIHRDMKPENILIHDHAKTDGYASPGMVKVTDFGLGKVANQMAANSIAYSQSIHDGAARELAGTIDYMAPEVRGGGEAEPRSDLYACGVILYEMLTGERPAGTEVPSDLDSSIPKYLDDVFRRAYSRLEKRFTSADEFANALHVVPPPIIAPKPSIVTSRSTEPINRGGARQCPSCRGAVDPLDQFCMHCGKQLAATIKRCPKCGAYPDASDRYCIFCGEGLPVKA